MTTPFVRLQGLIVLGVVVVDQIVKQMVRSRLAYGESLVICYREA